MKALIKAERKPGIWMTHDAPMPEIGPNDVLIKISKTAICGTDMHIYNWDEWSQKTIPVPMVTGHEFVGIVAKLGSEVVGLEVGDRVSGEGHITCGHCRNCRAGRRHLCHNCVGIGVNRTGCFAEYLSMPAVNAMKIPDYISDSVASVLDPLGNAAHTALSFDCIGEDVLITGAGPTGVFAASICKHIGARHIVVTDLNDHRLELAKQMGATRVVNVKNESLPQVMQSLGMSEGFDVGLEMSGSAHALRDMLAAMNHGGKIAMLGIPPTEVAIDWDQVIFKGLEIKGIYGREMFETWYKMISMLGSGLNVDAAITHHYAIDDFQEAFEMMNSGQSGKVILEW